MTRRELSERSVHSVQRLLNNSLSQRGPGAGRVSPRLTACQIWTIAVLSVAAACDKASNPPTEYRDAPPTTQAPTGATRLIKYEKGFITKASDAESLMGQRIVFVGVAEDPGKGFPLLRDVEQRRLPVSGLGFGGWPDDVEGQLVICTGTVEQFRPLLNRKGQPVSSQGHLVQSYSHVMTIIRVDHWSLGDAASRSASSDRPAP